MENEEYFECLLRLLGEGMSVKTRPCDGGLDVHVENRNKKKSLDFKAMDEEDAKKKAMEWMLGQMLLGYDNFRVLTFYLIGLEQNKKYMKYGRC